MDDPIYDIELEDCPICRGAGLIQDEQGWSVSVACVDCGAETAHAEYRPAGGAAVEHGQGRPHRNERLKKAVCRGVSRGTVFARRENGFGGLTRGGKGAILVAIKKR